METTPVINSQSSETLSGNLGNLGEENAWTPCAGDYWGFTVEHNSCQKIWYPQIAVCSFRGPYYWLVQFTTEDGGGYMPSNEYGTFRILPGDEEGQRLQLTPRFVLSDENPVSDVVYNKTQFLFGRVMFEELARRTAHGLISALPVPGPNCPEGFVEYKGKPTSGYLMDPLNRQNSP